MPFVPAICTQCGSKLRVDSSKEAAICPYCCTPFVTETAINNYNTNYTTNVEHLHADVVNLNDDKSIDSRVRAGETFIKLDDYAAAERIFKELTVECPYDYRGWWGLIKVYSRNFNDADISRIELWKIEMLYQKTCAVASAEEQSKIKPQYDKYFNDVNTSLDITQRVARDRIAHCQSTYEQRKSAIEQKKSAIESEIKGCEQRKRKPDSAGCAMESFAYIFGFIIFVVVLVDFIRGYGFWTGILGGGIAGIICSGIIWGIINLIDTPFRNAREKTIENAESQISSLNAQISSLNAQLADNEKDYHKEMAQLDAIMEKVR